MSGRRVGGERLRARGTVEAPRTHRPDDADALRLEDPEHLPGGNCTVTRRVMAHVGPVLPRQRLVGAGDGRPLGVVALVETAAGPEGHRHRVRVTLGWRWRRRWAARRRAGRRAVVQGNGGVRGLVGEAEAELRHGAGDAGKGADAGEGPGVVRWGWPWRRLRSSGTPAAPRCSAGRTGDRGSPAARTSQEQARSDQQHQGEGYLGRHQPLLGPECCPRGAPGSGGRSRPAGVPARRARSRWRGESGGRGRG